MDIDLSSNNLRNVATVAQMTKCISDHVNEMFGDKLGDLRGNLELVEAVCNAIETIVLAQKIKKVSKLEIFKSIYMGLFPTTTPAEMAGLVNFIEFIVSHDVVKAKVATSRWGRIKKAFRK